MNEKEIRLMQLKLDRENERQRLGIVSPPKKKLNFHEETPTSSSSQNRPRTILKRIRKSAANLTGLHGFISGKTTPSPSSSPTSPSPSSRSKSITKLTLSSFSFRTPSPSSSQYSLSENEMSKELLKTKALVSSLQQKLEKQRRRSLKRNSSFMQTHDGIVHSTKVRLNAEIASTKARCRMETLRLHGKILRLRKEKEALIEDKKKMFCTNETLKARLVEVELNCQDLLTRLSSERNRSKCSIDAMMKSTMLLREMKEQKRASLSRDNAWGTYVLVSVVFVLTISILFLVIKYFDRLYLRNVYTFLALNDFITTREYDNVENINDIMANNYLEDHLLSIQKIAMPTEDDAVMKSESSSSFWGKGTPLVGMILSLITNLFLD